MERVACFSELPPMNFEGSSLPGMTSSVDGTGGSLLNKCGDPWTVVQGMAIEVHELLGLGSSSYVFSCSMQGIDGRVAVKLLACDDQRLNENREVAILTQLQHPNLVALLNVVEGPPHALVLELCIGGSLQELMHGARFGKKLFSNIGPGARARLGLDVALAVQYLHDLQIVHRDVKSGNTFLTETVHPGSATLPPARLGDLGLARAVSSSSMMTKGIGTVRYMAPEVINSGGYGQSADIYSYGVLLHELLTGEMPFGHLRCNLAALAMAIAQGTLRLSFDGLPLGLGQGSRMGELLEDLLNSDPAERVTACDLVQRLSVQVGRLQRMSP
mmetsp:Transcript_56006/g.144536  ORF Transcript_56006/g.144536 Transcript_56006/m.144536 type:complete len:330 (-) Transcript_56006:273-1262(-)